MRNISFAGRFQALVGSTSKAMKSLNLMPPSDAARTAYGSANLKIIDKFKQELGSIRTYLETMHMKMRRATEHINLSEGDVQQVVDRNGKLKVKQTEDSKLCKGIDSEVSSVKTQCYHLIATTQENLVKEKALVKTHQEMAVVNMKRKRCSPVMGSSEASNPPLFSHMKLRRATEQINLSEVELPQVVNGKEQLKVKQTEDSKLWQGLDSAASATKTLCDQQTESLQQTACEKQRDPIIKQLEVSVAMVQHMEVTENKLRRLDSKAETSASNINWVGKLPYEDCENELIQQFLKLESDNQDLLDQEKPKSAEFLQGEISKFHPADRLENVINQPCCVLNGKEQLNNCSVEEKIEITNVEREKAEELTGELESNCNEKRSEKRQDFERYLKEKHGTTVARIQQDKEYNESTLQDYLKEELQRIIQSQVENELRERLSLVSQEHECQIKSLMMKHQEECQRMQDELDLQNSKEEKQSASTQLQKGMGENRQIDKELNSKKAAARSLHFPFHQFRMLSTNSIDGKAPGNTATIILDLYNIPASKRSYIRAINKVVKWCKANTKVTDLSEYFGPGAEVFTTPAEGIFHMKFRCRDLELTYFIKARDLYSVGWEGDKYGAFEIQEAEGKESERCVQIPGCGIVKMGVNYRTITKNALGMVRIGLPAMIDAFEKLYKCDGKYYNDAMEAVTIFAVNISEAIRDADIFKEVQDSFDLFLDRLDSRWDSKSGMAPLSSNIRTYSFYSKQYLKYVDCMISRKALPVITNRGDQNVKSIDELRNRIRVPSRDAYNDGEFHHEERPESVVWYPPYPDDKGWISDDEE